MSRLVRYSTNPHAEPTTPDTADVHYGDMDAGIPEGARLLPPTWPSKIVCVGRNYVAHAKELGNEVPTEPMIFLKPPSSLIGQGDSIVYPPITQLVHFEGELGVVIGKRAKNLSREDAWGYIKGYTVVNDVTARDLQKKDVQFTRGKGIDTFCAVGPCIVPAEEFDLTSARIISRLNGEVKQDGPVTDMIFPVDVILSFITQCMTLEPGDLILTGTPPGVGPANPGDTIEIEVTGIGVLKNSVIRG